MEAKQYATDYLHEVYQHIRTHIRTHMQRIRFDWGQSRIEFIFSIPTTWGTQQIIEDFKSLISKAGFGTESERHLVTLELTEAEAAAVYTIKCRQVSFAKGDVFLTCDAGGGTTDLALSLVTTGIGGILTLKQIATVDGINVGSTLIDRDFEDLVQKRLDAYSIVNSLPTEIPPDLPALMAASPHWMQVKHDFGSLKLPQHSVQIEKPPNYSNARLGIVGGRMVFSRY
jgi:hypothetical protein